METVETLVGILMVRMEETVGPRLEGMGELLSAAEMLMAETLRAAMGEMRLPMHLRTQGALRILLLHLLPLEVTGEAVLEGAPEETAEMP